MTFREKLSIEHPEYIGNIWDGGCKDCPYSYDYEGIENNICDNKTVNNDICTRCWNREYPGEPTKQEKMILDLRKNVFASECELSCFKKALKNVAEHIDPGTIIVSWETAYAMKSFLNDKFDKIKFSRRRWIGAFAGLSVVFIAFIIRYVIGS